MIIWCNTIKQTHYLALSQQMYQVPNTYTLYKHIFIESCLCKLHPRNTEAQIVGVLSVCLFFPISMETVSVYVLLQFSKGIKHQLEATKKQLQEMSNSYRSLRTHVHSLQCGSLGKLTVSEGELGEQGHSNELLNANNVNAESLPGAEPQKERVGTETKQEHNTLSPSRRGLSFQHQAQKACHACHLPSSGTESNCSQLNWMKNLLNHMDKLVDLCHFHNFFNMSVVLVMEIVGSNFNQHLLLFQHIPVVKGNNDFPVKRL